MDSSHDQQWYAIDFEASRSEINKLWEGSVPLLGVACTWVWQQNLSYKALFKKLASCGLLRRHTLSVSVHGFSSSSQTFG